MSTYTVDGAASIVVTATALPGNRAHAAVVLTALGDTKIAFHRTPLAKVVLSAEAWGRNILAGSSSLMRAVIRDDISKRHPFNFASVPDGIVLMANGIDPMLRWDGQSLQAEVAGVPAPTEAATIWLTAYTSDIRTTSSTAWAPGATTNVDDGAETVTTEITGNNFDFFAYVRYVDRHGNVSDLSPISKAAYGFIPGYTPPLPDGFGINSVFHYYRYSVPVTGSIYLVGGTDAVALAPGSEGAEPVSIEILTVPEIVADFGAFGITLSVDLDPPGQPGGTTVQQATYLDVPLPTGPFAGKVVRRQILRNTGGQASTWYVDIDTTDLTSDLFVSNNSDDDLLGMEAVPLFDDTGAPLANIHGFPPSWKSSIVSHLGRVFAAVDGVYEEGHIQVSAESDQVQGVGTDWPATMAGRALYVVGAREPYLIQSVDVANQILTLEQPYSDSSSIFAFYAIRPPAGEWRLVYYTPAGLPESWPPFYALSLQEDGDEITALMSLSSFLYIIEKRHIYRFTFKDDPATDGAVFLSSQRGCLNQRCWVQAEDTAYLLDEQGIHAFTGGVSQPISEPIQDLFRDDSPSPLKVDWDADQRYWHAAYSEVHATVRFFVAFTGNKYPRHAICYSYRTDRWWLEEYLRPICSSTRANVGIARVFVGLDHREMAALNVGWTDGLRDVGGTVQGTVGSSSATSLTDLSAHFTSDTTNLAVFLVSGRAKGQWRRVIAASSTRLDFLTPWMVQPRPGDAYIVAGIDFQWRAGWFRWTDSTEADNPRDVEIIYVPTDHGSLDLTLFYDHIEEPVPWSRDTDGTITLKAGDPIGIVDLNQVQGRAVMRLEGHQDTYVSGNQYVSPSLSGVQVKKPIRIFRLTMGGVEAEG